VVVALSLSDARGLIGVFDFRDAAVLSDGGFSTFFFGLLVTGCLDGVL